MKYNGAKPESEEEKEARRKYSLPITKQLVYYNLPYDKNSVPMNVEYFEEEKAFFSNDDDTPTWYSLKIYLEDGETRNIHSSFFKEMQSPSFIDNINSLEDREKE